MTIGALVILKLQVKDQRCIRNFRDNSRKKTLYFAKQCYHAINSHTDISYTQQAIELLWRLTCYVLCMKVFGGPWCMVGGGSKFKNCP